MKVNIIGLFLIGLFSLTGNIYSAQESVDNSRLNQISGWAGDQFGRLRDWWNRPTAAQLAAERNLGNIASGVSGAAGLTAGQNLGLGIGEAARLAAEQNLGNIASGMSGAAGLTAGQNLGLGIGEAARLAAEQNLGNIASGMSGAAGLTAGQNLGQGIAEAAAAQLAAERNLGNIAGGISGAAGLTAGQNLGLGIGEAARLAAEQNLGNIASGMSGAAGLTAGQNLGQGIAEAAAAQLAAERNLGNIASGVSGAAGLTAGQNLGLGIGEAARGQATQNFLEGLAGVAQEEVMQNLGGGFAAAAAAQDAYNRTIRGRLNQFGESVSNQFGQLKDWWNRPAAVPTMADAMSNMDAYFQPSWSQRLRGYGSSAMNWAGSNAAALRDYVMASRFVDNTMVNNFTHYIDQLTADNPLDESAALTKRLWQSADQNQRKYLLYTLLGLGGAAGLYLTGHGLKSLYNRFHTPQEGEKGEKKSGPTTGYSSRIRSYLPTMPTFFK